MKKNFTLILIAVLALTLSPLYGQEKKSRKKKAKPVVYFQWDDFQDDDRGPGYYTYPKHESYTEGTFDIIHFYVEESEDTIDFRIGIYGDIQNEAAGVSETNGFVHQMIDIYIDTDQIPGSGHQDCLPGRNAQFSRNSYWDKVVLVTPKDREYVLDYLKHRSEEYEVLEPMKKDIIIPKNYYVTRREIVARVDKKQIGIPQPWWGYQVLMLGNSVKINTSFRGQTFAFATGAKPNSLFNLEVQSFSGLFNFGGGSDYEGDSNIIDMLTDKGQKQRDILSNYRSHPNSTNNRWVELSCIYKAKPPVEKVDVSGKKNYSDVLKELRKRNEDFERIQKEQEKLLTMGREKIALDKESFNPRNMEKDYQKIVEKSKQEKIREKQIVVPRPEVEKTQTSTQICREHMEKVYEAANRYHTRYTDDKNITLYDLISEGVLAENVMCPDGGRYAIYGEDSGSLKVRCFNPSGEEHGIFERNKR